jgi:hypothetical protein
MILKIGVQPKNEKTKITQKSLDGNIGNIYLLQTITDNYN